MSETVGGFCRDLREELEQGRPLDPEAVPPAASWPASASRSVPPWPS